MTNEEVIERIRDHMNIHRMNEPRAIHITEALTIAISAIEKQIPKKPRLRKGCNWIYRCPSCTHLLYWTDEPKDHGTKDNYCTRCGQRIEWEGE